MITDSINNQAYFNELKSRPFIAWPTVILLFACLGSIATAWYLVLTENIPLWAGFIMNFVAYYFLFSPIHDGAHRSLSSEENINEFFTACAYLPIYFIAPAPAYARMFHMQHHRHTGKKDLDPDIEISSKGSNALHKWFIWGSQYNAYFLKFKEQLPRVEVKYQTPRNLISMACALYLFISFPLESLFLWIVPMLAGLTWMIAFVFSYLPHHIHKRVPGEDPLDPYQSTCNLVGLEWLLSPIMQYQNYHLVHHLYPTVPFYRYVKVWRAGHDQHMKHNPALMKAPGVSDSLVSAEPS